MPVWLVALMFAFGVGGFVYTKVARSTGNYSPKLTFGSSIAAAVIVYIFFFTLMKYILGL